MARRSGRRRRSHRRVTTHRRSDASTRPLPPPRIPPSPPPNPVARYVIYQQKQMLGKPHNTSYHSTAGLASIGAFCALSVSGVAGLHPDVGLLRTSGLVRSVHRLGGRAAASVSFAALASGTATIAGAGRCLQNRIHKASS